MALNRETGIKDGSTYSMCARHGAHEGHICQECFNESAKKTTYPGPPPADANPGPWRALDSVETKYKHDAPFRQAVDILRAFLGEYRLTPSELREAVILATMMHESQVIRPLFISPYPGRLSEPTKHIAEHRADYHFGGFVDTVRNAYPKPEAAQNAPISDEKLAEIKHKMQFIEPDEGDTIAEALKG